MAQNDSLSELLQTAVEAAKRAGEIIREGFYQTKHVEHKGLVDLVTETDKACEDLIFNYLKQQHSSHKFIGEETTAACGITELTDEPTWIVDPLDGTTNFVHGFPFVCISIGLTIGKVPTVGVVYNPIMEELFTGVHGKGAFLNGKPIKVSSQSELVKSLLATEVLPLSNSKSGHPVLLSSKSGQLVGDSKRMKGLFKSKPRTPVDIVRQTRDLLIYADQSSASLSDSKREEKMAELAKNIRELKSILYGNSESEPVSEACAQLTQEFFRENTLRLLIFCLSQLNLEARKDATQVVANLQRQQVNSRLIASDYLEKNTDLLDTLIAGYENTDMALHYGVMLRECIRHQTVARYVLESPNVKKFFDYIQLPYFDISADAAATFKELLTRHKSTVAEFLSKNYDWFFAEFNSKLLESTNYITRRQAVKLLGDILLDRSNAVVMTRYVSSRDNLRILMNLLRESSKSIQIEAFHVFKLFAANQNKPPDIVNILVANRSKLLRLFADFKIDKEDEQFEADKAQVVREIAALEPRE